MSLRAHLTRLEERLRAISRKDPDLAAALTFNLRLVRESMAAPIVERAVVNLLALLDQLEAHERANAPVARTAKRKLITPAQAADAVRTYGGVRAAARALHCSHQTILRKIQAVHGPVQTANTIPAAP